jgi:dipeptidyl aminopeptidase/acylaminoacyl peptidase
MNRSAAFLAALFLWAPLAAADTAAAKKPFTIEDFYRAKGVGEPALSPDGKGVVYAVTTSDLKAGKRATNLWRVDADGRNARQLTYSEKRDASPVFSPDGKKIAFLSNRGGETQLFFLPSDGGEATAMTSFPGGVGGPLFSPDGRFVALTASVWPECGVDAECNKKLNEKYEKGKLHAHVADRLLYRHWNEWNEGRRTHILVLDVAKGKDALRDVTPGELDSPAFSVGGAGGYDFSPDGREIVFASDHDPDPAMSTNTDIFVVPVAGTDEELKHPKNLTAKNEAFDGSARFSPDGKTIYYRTQTIPHYESDRFRLAAMDRATGATRTLTEGFDNWVTDFAVGKDGKRLFFTADVKGRTPLHELDLATGTIRTLSAKGYLDAFEISRDGRLAIVARRQIAHPSELYRLDFDPKGEARETRLTTHNEALEREVDIRDAEEVTLPGAGGEPVQMWIVKPHGFEQGKKYPLILNVHGGPQSQWADSFRGDWQVYPGAGYVVAFPNPHGSTGFGQAYTAAISGDWNGKVMEDVRAVTNWLKKQPYVDAEKMGAMGWSWGGYAMMWLEGHNDLGFKALASMMGAYDLRAKFSSTEELWFPAWDLKGAPWENPQKYAEWSPSNYVVNFKTPCLVITGEKDYRIPYTQSLEFFNDLQRMKVPSRLVVWENAGHWPSWIEMSLYYAAHLDWFHRYLGGGPSPWDPVKMAEGRAWDEEKKDKTDKPGGGESKK